VKALFNAVPTVAWIEIALMWVGLEMGPTVFLIVVTTLPLLVMAAVGWKITIRGVSCHLGEWAISWWKRKRTCKQTSFRHGFPAGVDVGNHLPGPVP